MLFAVMPTPTPSASSPGPTAYVGLLRAATDGQTSDEQPYIVLRQLAVAKADQLAGIAPPDHQAVSFAVTLHAPTALSPGDLRLFLLAGLRYGVAPSAPLGLTPDLDKSTSIAGETVGWMTFIVPADLHAGQLLMILGGGAQATLEVSW